VEYTPHPALKELIRAAENKELECTIANNNLENRFLIQALFRA